MPDPEFAAQPQLGSVCERGQGGAGHGGHAKGDGQDDVLHADLLGGCGPAGPVAGWRGGRLEHGVDRIYYDGRAGLGTALGAYHLHALWVTTRGRGGYLADDLPHDAGADGRVVGVTRFW